MFDVLGVSYSNRASADHQPQPGQCLGIELVEAFGIFQKGVDRGLRMFAHQRFGAASLPGLQRRHDPVMVGLRLAERASPGSPRFERSTAMATGLASGSRLLAS